MPGWDRFPVREVLAREHGCPVVVDNDVNIMAIGERHGGVADSVDNLLFVKIGTGIGCGIYLNGEVYRGTDGCAGDIGHIQVDAHGPVCSCGNVGCLEALFGGAALARDADRRRRGRGLARRWPSGWPPAARSPRRTSPTAPPRATSPASGSSATAAGGSAAVLAGLVSFINPSMIVIGGGLAGSATSCSPRSAAWSTAARCRWPPATCRWCCPSSARAPAWSARPCSPANSRRRGVMSDRQRVHRPESARRC